MTEELLETTSEMVEGLVDTVNEMEIPVNIEIDFDEVQDIMSEYSRGALHASTAIGAGFGVYKLLKNRNKIKNTVKTFIDKNREALSELKAKKEKVEVEVK